MIVLQARCIYDWFILGHNDIVFVNLAYSRAPRP